MAVAVAPSSTAGLLGINLLLKCGDELMLGLGEDKFNAEELERDGGNFLLRQLLGVLALGVELRHCRRRIVQKARRRLDLFGCRGCFVCACDLRDGGSEFTNGPELLDAFRIILKAAVRLDVADVAELSFGEINLRTLPSRVPRRPSARRM